MATLPLIPALGTEGGSPIPANRILLLEAIAESGSISQAAKAAGLSYRGAWNALDDLNGLSETPLVSTNIGGKGGGGAYLTPAGRHLISVYRAMEQLQRSLLRDIAALPDAASSLQTLRKLMLKTSARNQLYGTVSHIAPGHSNDQITLTLPGDLTLLATITRESTELLELKPGSAVAALVKASWVRLTAGHNPSAVSGDNALHGHISPLLRESGQAEVAVLLTNGLSLVAQVDKAEAWPLHQPVTAHIAAGNIILGVGY
ncbi:TOBE domain-containing protein [Chitinimonas sp. JJ19]|uniref:TOBE domain-containing protein n=1 Tax=Chitinimonas sp. JJ19 TaxID=3109352 RepID=UPI0030039BEB